MNEENKENQTDNIEKRHTLPTKHHLDFTFVESDTSEWQPISDESFEVLEKMCNKTASDPDSTLFEYLHSDEKEKVIQDAKKRSGNKNDLKPQRNNGYDAEAAALERLLTELRVEEKKQLENQSPLLEIDVTQLEDIEAPSRLWENSISGDTIVQTSPIKMIGLLRPSTIIEEHMEESASSNVSEIGSRAMSSESCYETALDSTSSDNYMCRAMFKISSIDKLQPQITNATEESADQSIDLIDLDNTLFPPQASLIKLESDSDESVVEISSNDEENFKEMGSLSPSLALENGVNSDKTVESNEESLHFDDTIEEVDYMMKKAFEYMAVEAASNCVTNEELCGDIAAALPSTPSKPPIAKQNTFTLTLEMNERYRSPLPMSQKQKPSDWTSFPKATVEYASPKKIPTPTAQSKPTNRFALDIKPIPKLDLFKKPIASGIPVNANLHQTKHSKFSHIVSPVGAYIKRTGTTPFMTTIKGTNTNAEFDNATALKELELESRLYKPKFELGASAKGHDALQETPTTTLSLPKKAYVSSVYKVINDERTPVKIPGGNSIKKYLETAMLPAVVRHEGKRKLTSGLTGVVPKTKDDDCNAETSKNPRRKDDSLADLSVMSGDVSVYTLRDAQKF